MKRKRRVSSIRSPRWTKRKSKRWLTSDSFWSSGISFVLGKSLVGGSVTGDIFEGITPGAIPFARPEATPAPLQPEVSVELAGPWHYYADFRRAHGLTHLPHPEPPEIAQQAGGTFVIPLWLRNQTADSREFTLSVKLPPGWSLASWPSEIHSWAEADGSSAHRSESARA